MWHLQVGRTIVLSASSKTSLKREMVKCGYTGKIRCLG
jgi:hypothetical protein